MCTMKNYEKPIAEILMFRLAEVRMVTRKSYTPGNKARQSGSGDKNGDSDNG